MEFIQKPPQWLLDMLPEGGRDFLNNGGWWGILGLGAVVVLLLLWALGSKFLGLFRRAQLPQEKSLAENLADYPPLPPSTGDRRLLVEGVPVRLRLVVVAPAGKELQVDTDRIEKVLEGVLLGLGDIAVHDHPRVCIWPAQLSYEGFARTFHRNTVSPDGDKEPSRWVMVAGRALAGKKQFLLGLAMQAVKPTTVGRKTLKADEWSSVLRVRVRD